MSCDTVKQSVCGWLYIGFGALINLQRLLYHQTPHIKPTYLSKGYQRYVKYKQHRLGFELLSLCSFLSMVTVKLCAPPSSGTNSSSELFQKVRILNTLQHMALTDRRNLSLLPFLNQTRLHLVCIYQPLNTNRTRHSVNFFFKRSLTGLNSELPFSLPGCHT